MRRCAVEVLPWSPRAGNGQTRRLCASGGRFWYAWTWRITARLKGRATSARLDPALNAVIKSPVWPSSNLRRAIETESMKLRHAAALTLLGWYLMIPPIQPDGTVDSDAPLARWRIEGNLNSSASCEAMRDSLRGTTALARGAQEPPVEVELAADHQAVCVATDDPRLEESSK